jgi:hypothetical protein
MIYFNGLYTNTYTVKKEYKKNYLEEREKEGRREEKENMHDTVYTAYSVMQAIIADSSVINILYKYIQIAQ